MNENYYIYRHRRLDNNKIFYVGLGSNENFKRAFEKRNRNKYWKNITAKVKYTVEIIAKNLSYSKACELEIFLIKLYGRKIMNTGILCNITEGREGVIIKRKKLSFSERVGISKNKKDCTKI